MLRKIIRIDEEKCNGCGACARACHEGAIAMVNGKARLVREDYCDGLGDCLPACPTNAISFEVREAAAYDEAAVRAAKAAAPHACPGSRPAAFVREARPASAGNVPSQLSQWPVQIKLAPVNAPWFSGADLLIAADCTAFAYGNFHADFIRGRVTLVGCPKLDAVDYAEKLAQILFRQRHPLHHRGAHGSALLRRSGKRRAPRAGDERQGHPPRRLHHRHKRRAFGKRPLKRAPRLTYCPRKDIIGAGRERSPPFREGFFPAHKLV